MSQNFFAKVLAWDACLPYQLFKNLLCEPHQSFGLKVGNDQREDSWGNLVCYLLDGQYFIPLEIFCKSAHPVCLVFLRSPLLAFPGCGALWGRLNRAVL